MRCAWNFPGDPRSADYDRRMSPPGMATPRRKVGMLKIVDTLSAILYIAHVNDF
jgi:hypothetical protein